MIMKTKAAFLQVPPEDLQRTWIDLDACPYLDVLTNNGGHVENV